MTYGVRMGERPDPSRWKNERRWLRRGPGSLYRRAQTWRFLLGRDRAAALAFLRADYPLPLPLGRRLRLLRQLMRVSDALRGYHTLEEILRVGDRILRLAHRRDLLVVEVGAGSGASTAKLSLFVELAGGRLLVFDTFQGIPENDERHHLLDGRELRFMKGAFRGRLGAVRRRVARFGAIERCEFHKGLAQQTLPLGVPGAVDVALLDVDLVASTEACVAHLMPRLRAGGRIFSQDGHLRATHALLADPAFWSERVGMTRPRIDGLLERVEPGSQGKLLEVHPG
ncbi:MAG: class I SAM-dependent methyltransferase [Myxococcales bacterium]|nr:class I SAM-dependent methyltransferase [Myxococcales bacterium]